MVCSFRSLQLNSSQLNSLQLNSLQLNPTSGAVHLTLRLHRVPRSGIVGGSGLLGGVCSFVLLILVVAICPRQVFAVSEHFELKSRGVGVVEDVGVGDSSVSEVREIAVPITDHFESFGTAQGHAGLLRENFEVKNVFQGHRSFGTYHNTDDVPRRRISTILNDHFRLARRGGKFGPTHVGSKLFSGSVSRVGGKSLAGAERSTRKEDTDDRGRSCDEYEQACEKIRHGGSWVEVQPLDLVGLGVFVLGICGVYGFTATFFFRRFDRYSVFVNTGYCICTISGLSGGCYAFISIIYHSTVGGHS